VNSCKDADTAVKFFIVAHSVSIAMVETKRPKICNLETSKFL